MSHTKPELGIALAAYRPSINFFLDQLQSISDQSYHDWVCFVGLDSPLAELNSPEIAKFINDPRFLFFENSIRLGHKKNFENVAQKLLVMFPSIKFIAFCDQDDIWYPSKLDKSLGHLRELPPYSGVQSDMHLLGTTSPGQFSILRDSKFKVVTGWGFENKIMSTPDLATMIANNHVAGTAMLVRAEVIRDFGSIPDSFEFHDHWYGLIASFLGQLQPIPEPLFQYRQHDSNVTGASKRVGLFKIRSQSSSLIAAKVSYDRFNICQARIRDFCRITRSSWVVTSYFYLSKTDLGLGFLLLTAKNLIRQDFRRARSTLSMFVGKVIWIFNLQNRLNQYLNHTQKL